MKTPSVRASEIACRASLSSAASNTGSLDQFVVTVSKWTAPTLSALTTRQYHFNDRDWLSIRVWMQQPHVYTLLYINWMMIE